MDLFGRRRIEERKLLLDNIIPKIVGKVTASINIKSSKRWIYELLTCGSVLRIRDPDKPGPDIDDPRTRSRFDVQQARKYSTFIISEVIELSPETNTNRSLTVIGRFHGEDCDYFGPYQKICVPLEHISLNVAAPLSNCYEEFEMRRRPRSMYTSIFSTVEAVCKLIRRLNGEQRKLELSDECDQVLCKIRSILKVSRSQYRHYPIMGIITCLLRTDWKYFCEFLKDVLGERFTNLQDTRCLYELMDVAMKSDNLNHLRQQQWFMRQFMRPTGRFTFNGQPRIELVNYPENWSVGTFADVIKEFCNDAETFFGLDPFIDAMVTNRGCDFEESMHEFVDRDGIRSVFTIVTVTIINWNAENSIRRTLYREMHGRCRQILCMTLNFHLPVATVLRHDMVEVSEGLARDVGFGFRQLYWWTLEEVLGENKEQQCNVKALLKEMCWFMDRFALRNGDFEELTAALHFIRLSDFEDDEINRNVQIILNSILQ